MERRFWRRQYLINSRFQLRWSVLLGLVAALGATLFAVPFYGTLDTQNRMLNKSLKDAERIYTASLDITVLLMNIPETSFETTEVAGKRFDKAYAGLESIKQAKMAMVERNKTIQTLVWMSVPALAIIMFIFGILVTHSVAGPLYVMKRQLEKYGDTGHLDERSLRGGDEFIDVYATLFRVLSEEKNRHTTKE